MQVVKESSSKVVNPVLFRSAIRFAFTGIFVTGIYLAIAILSIQYLFYAPPLANGVAFVGATIVSYVINTVWSFSARLNGKILCKFFTVSMVGFLLAMLVAWIVQELGFSYLLGIFAVTLTIPPMTFILHNFWTFR